MPPRKKLKLITVVTVSLIAIISIWGVVIEPRWVQKIETSGTVPCLPKEWENVRFGLIADLQVGMWFDNESAIREAGQMLVDSRPAFVLIAGDFVYHPTQDDSQKEALQELDPKEVNEEVRKQIVTAVNSLSPLLKSGIPVYAVLGNHDYAMQTETALKLEAVAQVVRTALIEAGITVLHNEAVPLLNPQTQQADLMLVGLGPSYPEEVNIDKALQGLQDNTPRLLVMHNPESFPEIPAFKAPLAVAGHTHGGQIRIPFMEDWSWMRLVKTAAPHVDGWIANYGQIGNNLYVNKGIGFSRFPIRINCRPEVTIVTLKGAQCST